MTFNITHITKGNNQKHFLIVALIRYHLQRNRYVVINTNDYIFFHILHTLQRITNSMILLSFLFAL